MRFIAFCEKTHFRFDSIMQKNVLVPIENYQRLLERNTTNSKETRDAATETERHLENPREERTEEKAEATIEAEKTSSQEEVIPVSEKLDNFKTLEKPVKKRQRRSRPPGIKDYKSVWIKLNGRL